MNTYRIATGVIAVFVLPFLLPVNAEMWDGIIWEAFYLTKDTDFIASLHQSQFFKYYFYIGIDNIAQLTHVPPKIIVNLISAIAVCGLAREGYKWLRERFGFSEKHAIIGAWAILAFPVWHTLISGIMFLNIVCLWSFMVAVNQWRKNRLLAVPFFLFSLQLFSLFSLAVGFAAAEFLLEVNRDNFKSLQEKAFGFCLILLAGYMAIDSFGEIHSNTGYNTFNLDRLRSFVNFGIMSAVFLGVIGILRSRLADKAESQRVTRLLLAFITLSFFAGLAYWAVGRPMRFFSFGSFTARHTYLTCIPFALLVALIAELLENRIPRKAYTIAAVFFATALVVLLHQGYSHKIAAVVFKEAFTEQLTLTEAPPSGYVGIKSVGPKEAPRHVQDFAMNMCFYKAYGKAAWKANGFWRRHLKPTKENVMRTYEGATRFKRMMAWEVTGDAFTKYRYYLDGYHQEGRFWYWWYYLTGDYSAFNPRLELVEQVPGNA